MASKRFSLRTKIFLTMGIALLVPIVTMSIYAIKTQKARLLNQRMIFQESVLQITMNGIMLFMSNNNPEEIHNSLNGLRDKTHLLAIRILDSKGTIKYSSNDNEPGKAIPKIAGLIAKSNTESGNSHLLIEDDKNLMTVTRRIPKEERCLKCHTGTSPYIGYLSIEGDISDITRELAIHQREDILISAGVLIALIVAVSGVHLRFVQFNIKQMLKAIGEVEQGNFRTHIPIDDSEEMGRLATSFNRMIDKLNQMREELRIAHLNELQRADKLANVGELAASMAHEIKNPVAGISGAMQALLKDTNESSANKPIFEEILTQIQRVDHAVNSLLTYSRPRPPRMVLCRMEEVIRHALQLTHQKARLVNVETQLELDDTSPPIVADSEQLEQVLVNLIMNGIQAMPTGGRLKVHQHYDLEAERMYLQVTDTGMGIEEDKLNIIFKPFYTTKHNGTGLGLAICRGIIHRHGGEIEVKSTPGSGTSFTIILPVTPLEPFRVPDPEPAV